ncbi:MAG TPA: hypothetical protein VJ024_09860 [Thermodesulfovibrionales bacterium]|nr:hypothetical protein [Thermodesulfovibrionales bacterium]
MSMSVRLDKETESILSKTAKILQTSKGKVIKHSLTEYCSRILEENRIYPYDLIKDLLDKEGSGKGDLSIRGEEILRKAFRRKG